MATFILEKSARFWERPFEATSDHAAADFTLRLPVVARHVDCHRGRVFLVRVVGEGPLHRDTTIHDGTLA